MKKWCGLVICCALISTTGISFAQSNGSAEMISRLSIIDQGLDRLFSQEIKEFEQNRSTQSGQPGYYEWIALKEWREGTALGHLGLRPSSKEEDTALKNLRQRSPESTEERMARQAHEWELSKKEYDLRVEKANLVRNLLNGLSDLTTREMVSLKNALNADLVRAEAKQEFIKAVYEPQMRGDYYAWNKEKNSFFSDKKEMARLEGQFKSSMGLRQTQLEKEKIYLDIKGKALQGLKQIDSALAVRGEEVDSGSENKAENRLVSYFKKLFKNTVNAEQSDIDNIEAERLSDMEAPGKDIERMKEYPKY
ncbi:MAG: hypothetical protein ACXVCP_17660 [Bdellovibrio sp.]